jgi:hypothetical protein
MTAKQDDEWMALYANRDEVADEYARLLRVAGTAWDGWQAFNEAILRRWSMAGLRYIKTKAWKIVKQEGTG